ncbi:MAG: hypothetical protein WA705_09405 [Candidatus Ozemobacteraceae bacterium]
MQIRIHGVPVSSTNQVALAIGNGGSTTATWTKTNSMTIADDIVLVYGQGGGFSTVQPFLDLTFQDPLAPGVKIDIYDLDTRQIIAERVVPSGNLFPTVNIGSPANESNGYAGGSLTIETAASDPDDGINRI